MRPAQAEPNQQQNFREFHGDEWRTLYLPQEFHLFRRDATEAIFIRNPQTTAEDRAQLQRQLNERKAEQMANLVSWWTQRIYNSPAPLAEKMTLFWHGHFATSAEKVNSYRMWLQNETLRMYALGNFGTLVKAISCDPAMLVWLDLGVSLPTGAPLTFVYRQLGQLPFYPPNVKGWDGGKSWINTATLAYRYELARELVNGILPEQVGLPKAPPKSSPSPAPAARQPAVSGPMRPAANSPPPKPTVTLIPPPAPTPPSQLTGGLPVGRILTADDCRDSRRALDVSETGVPGKIHSDR